MSMQERANAMALEKRVAALEATVERMVAERAMMHVADQQSRELARDLKAAKRG